MTSAALVHDHRCQKGHSTRLAWDPEQLISLLEEGALALYCAQCRSARPATGEDVAGLRRLATIAAGRAVVDGASNDETPCPCCTGVREEPCPGARSKARPSAGGRQPPRNSHRSGENARARARAFSCRFPCLTAQPIALPASRSQSRAPDDHDLEGWPPWYGESRLQPVHRYPSSRRRGPAAAAEQAQ